MYECVIFLFCLLYRYVVLHLTLQDGAVSMCHICALSVVGHHFSNVKCCPLFPEIQVRYVRVLLMLFCILLQKVASCLYCVPCCYMLCTLGASLPDSTVKYCASLPGSCTKS